MSPGKSVGASIGGLASGNGSELPCALPHAVYHIFSLRAVRGCGICLFQVRRFCKLES